MLKIGDFNMNDEIYFIGAGNDGDETAVELSRIYESMANDIYYKADEQQLQYLQINSFRNYKKSMFDVENKFIILAGSIHNHYWQEARKKFSEQNPYLMLTIGIGFDKVIVSNTLLTFKNECLIFPDPFVVNPVDVAQLVLQIFLIHMPWNICQMGSLIGYDFADTKNVFAGKVIKIKQMTSCTEHYRQNFSKFLDENKKTLSKSQGILLSLWSQDKVLSISKANELMKEIESYSDRKMFTFHLLPRGKPEFMTTMLIALRDEYEN
jgi:hypothetical protein